MPRRAIAPETAFIQRRPDDTRKSQTILRLEIRGGRETAMTDLRFNLTSTLAIGLGALVCGCYTGVSSHPAVGDTDLPSASSDAETPSGTTGDAEGSAGEAGDESGDAPADDACSANGELAAGTAPLRRITAAQYRHIVGDALGISADAEGPLAGLTVIPDGRVAGFASSTLAVDSQLVRSYMTVAEETASVYVGEGLVADLGCEWATQGCAEELLDSVGRRLHRRPVDDGLRARLLELHAETVAAESPDAAMELVIATLLMSPNFLYLEEPVTDQQEGELQQLDGYAVASRLSLLLWNSGPDDELLDLARDGMLAERAEVEVQVGRMIEDPRFERTLESFHRQWMHLEGLENEVREDELWNDELPQSMLAETDRFVRHVFGEGDGTLQTLLGADFSFVDDALAELYGVDAPAEPFGQVELDPARRAGILTQASLLARLGGLSPEVHRGLFVRTQVLCQELPPPPAGLVLDPEVNRLEDPTCAACHTLIDPIGFGFAQYDGVGRFNAGAETPAGELQGVVDEALAGPFDGPADLGRRLGSSSDARTCMAKQWARYATGRAETDEDACSIRALADAMENSDGDLRQLVAELATSTWFRSRSIHDL